MHPPPSLPLQQQTQKGSPTRDDPPKRPTRSYLGLCQSRRGRATSLIPVPVVPLLSPTARTPPFPTDAPAAVPAAARRRPRGGLSESPRERSRARPFGEGSSSRRRGLVRRRSGIGGVGPLSRHGRGKNERVYGQRDGTVRRRTVAPAHCYEYVSGER